MRLAPLPAFAAAAILCSALPTPAQPRAADGPAAVAPVGAQAVPLPHPLREDSGLVWNVNVDGSVTDGENQLFDAGGQLFVGPNAPYAPPIQQATFDAGRNELLFPPQPLAGLSVSRRVSVDAKGGWCRFVEVLENPTPNVVRTQVKLRFDLSAGIQAAEPVVDEKRGGRQRGVALFDGNHGVALVAAARGSRLAPRFASEPGGDATEFSYDVEVPARGTIALAHVHARRATLNEAAAFARSAKERDWLRGLPRQVISWVANFPSPDRLVGGAEVLRGDLLDVVELRGGDLYKGTLKESVYKLQTPYGPIELPAERVVAMVTLGEFRPSQLLITTDGQIFGGTLAAGGGALRLELSSGQVTSVPLSTVRRFGYRTRAGEADEAQSAPAAAAPATAPGGDKPLALLRSGDRVAVEMPPSPIPVATCYGLLRLDPRAVASLSFQPEEHEHGVHEVRLTDGSRFAGVVAQEKFDLKLLGAGTGASGARAASFPAAGISRLQLGREPEEPGREAATVTCGNGDVLVGTLTGKVVLETAFDAIEVNADELRSLRPGAADGPAGGQPAPAPTEVQLTLWDGATLSGRLRSDALECRLGCGTTVRVPVSLVREYDQPLPRPPAQALQRIKAVVAELNADDWKARDRAAAQLAALGPGAAGVLKSLREGQPPEVRQRIDQIVASFEAVSGPAPAPHPPVTVPGPVEANPPADADTDVPPQ